MEDVPRVKVIITTVPNSLKRRSDFAILTLPQRGSDLPLAPQPGLTQAQLWRVPLMSTGIRGRILLYI